MAAAYAAHPERFLRCGVRSGDRGFPRPGTLRPGPGARTWMWDGLLTRELIAAAHRVIATDASVAMLGIARELVGESAQEGAPRAGGEGGRHRIGMS
jgi:hypothetical protein